MIGMMTHVLFGKIVRVTLAQHQIEDLFPMQSLRLELLLLLLLTLSPELSAQTVKINPSQSEGLARIVRFSGYPNSMLFHNAFYAGNSTRFLLLKASLQSPEIADRFEFTKDQIETIRELSPIENVGKPENDSIDEQAINPDFYSFLNDAQRTKLDALTIRFDGLAALTRISLKERVNISDDSVAKIQEIVGKIRNEVLLRFRMNYAAVLPTDQAFRDVDYSGRVLTHVNETILQSLTPKERDRLFEFLQQHFDHELIRAVEKLAPLPQGLIVLTPETE